MHFYMGRVLVSTTVTFWHLMSKESMTQARTDNLVHKDKEDEGFVWPFRSKSAAREIAFLIIAAIR